MLRFRERIIGSVCPYVMLGTKRTIRELGLRENHEHCLGSSKEGLLEEVTWAES